ncbi:AMIN-like domain-containing (lipo)protein [Nocardia brasiliensis]
MVIDLAGNRTFRQVAWAGSFEARTTVGPGVRARLPMQVCTLDGPG